MPLTSDEIAFLGSALAEYSELRSGPAWQLLRGRGIRCDDLTWLMEAYKFVEPPCVDALVTPDGVVTEVLRVGRHQELLPPCPWPDPETARERNRVMEIEVRALRRSPAP